MIDLCLVVVGQDRAEARGIQLIVSLAMASHPGRRVFTDRDKHQSQWDTYLERLRRKWIGVAFVTT